MNGTNKYNKTKDHWHLKKLMSSIFSYRFWMNINVDQNMRTLIRRFKFNRQWETYISMKQHIGSRLNPYGSNPQTSLKSEAII